MESWLRAVASVVESRCKKASGLVLGIATANATHSNIRGKHVSQVQILWSLGSWGRVALAHSKRESRPMSLIPYSVLVAKVSPLLGGAPTIAQ